MSKLSKIFRNWRVIFVLVVLAICIYAIHPWPWTDGVAIRSVETGSAAYDAGLRGPSPTQAPTARERILEINNIKVNSEQAYSDIISNFEPNNTITMTTSRSIYKITVLPLYNVTVLSELVNGTIEVEEPINVTINGTEVLVNQTVNKTVLVNKTISNVIGAADIGLKITKPATTNIVKGLDLQGGTRVLLKPEEKLSDADMGLLIDGMKQRLNVYGLSDIVVRQANDLSGNSYVLVEVAGINEEEVKNLIGKQGKFEAKISSDIVFRGGKDVVDVCRSATCAGIDPSYGCSLSAGNSYVCRFRFAITLSQDAANKQWMEIKDLPTVTESGTEYTSKNLDLYLDDVLVDSLRIGAELQQKPSTDIAISGSGTGATRDLAVANAISEMKRLQTILITGSLPVKLSISKTDFISPVFGSQLIGNAFLIAIVAFVLISLFIMLMYRKVQIVLPIILICFSEIVMLLGVAAIIKWNIDLSAIAGIIASVGTGVNDQIIIMDETLRGHKERVYSWAAKIKNAFFIIMGAYFTILVAMLPLFFAGAGLFRGFALTTIIGITIGVFITRPAYGKIVEILMEEQ
jgi:preprotein translocase subunit SecD